MDCTQASTFVQASMFVTDNRKDASNYKLWPFAVNYISIMFHCSPLSIHDKVRPSHNACQGTNASAYFAEMRVTKQKRFYAIAARTAPALLTTSTLKIPWSLAHSFPWASSAWCRCYNTSSIVADGGTK
jgi:hypothetical protein